MADAAGTPRLADLRDRVGDVAAFLGSVARLLGGMTRDPRVPWSAKAFAIAATGYVLSPLDVIPDVLPVVGRLDDLWLVSRALRHLVRAAGHDVLREHWDGTDEGFAALLFLAGVQR